MADVKDRNDARPQSEIDEQFRRMMEAENAGASSDQSAYDEKFNDIIGSQFPSGGSHIPNPLDAKDVLDSLGKNNSKSKDLSPADLGDAGSFLKPGSAKGLEAAGEGATRGGAGRAAAGKALSKEAGLLATDPRVKLAATVWKHKKKILLGGVVTAGMIMIIGLFSILQGPLQFLHFASLLEQYHLPFPEDQTLARLGQVYRDLGDPNISDEKRLGLLTDVLAKDFEEEGTEAGVTLEFETRSETEFSAVAPSGNPNQLNAITISADNEDTVSIFEREYGDLGEPINGQYRIDNLYEDQQRAKQALDAYSMAIGVNTDQVSALERRRLKVKADVSYKWLDTIEADDETTLEEAYIKDRSGKIINGKTNTVNEEYVPEVNPLDEEEARQQTIEAGGGSVVGGLCRAYAVADDLTLQNDLVWLPAMRTSSKMLSLGSQIKANFNVRNEELRLEYRNFNTDAMVYEGVTPADGGTLVKQKVNWTASASLRQRLGETGGEPADPDRTPRVLSQANALATLSERIIAERVPGADIVCETINNDGGIISVIIENLANSLLASVLPSETLETLVDVAARGNIGNPIQFYTSGPGLWETADTGTLLVMNEEGWSSGALPIPAEAEEEINFRVNAEQKASYAQKSLLARLFDYKDARSLVAQLIIRADYSNSPATYSQRALAAISPERLGRTLSHPAYAATASAASVQGKYYGIHRVGWTEEELAHALAKDGVDNSASNYEEYIFQDEHDLFLKYSSLFANMCYGMEIEADGSVVPLESGATHVDDPNRRGGAENQGNYCQGAAQAVKDSVEDNIQSFVQQRNRIAKEKGWSESEIAAGQNSSGIRICTINKETRDLCSKITVLRQINGEMATGPSNSGCWGVFYLPYSHALHNARADFDEPNNFPENGDCFTFPGERLHQNTRIYLSLMGALQSSACLSDVDNQACSDIGIRAKSNDAPSDSDTPLGEVQCPANIVGPNNNGYYQLPEAPNGEYTFWSNTPPNERWGSRELVCTLYTVAVRYKEIYKNDSTLVIHDLNSSSHLSHKWGVAVDVHAAGNIWAADQENDGGKYSTEATETLGKLFADSTYLRNVWWCEPNDGSLNTIKEYAATKGDGYNSIKCLPNHYDHFHIDLDTQYRLPEQFNF